MDDIFDNPGVSAGIKWEDYAGRLMLITPHASEKDVNTAIGVKDAIRADVVVLDGPGSPEDLPDVLVFPRVLQGQLRSNVGTGRKCLGRLGQGEKRPGQNAPWKLGDPTDADRATARNFLAGREGVMSSAPSGTTTPPF